LTDAPSTEVSGRVTIEGEPLFHGAVAFVPVDPAHRTSAAEVRWGRDGKFQTQTSSPLTVGSYRVRVHRFATDRVPPMRGQYSIPDAVAWDVPGVVEIAEGMEPLALSIDTAQ
jgi:hypothetical protein